MIAEKIYRFFVGLIFVLICSTAAPLVFYVLPYPDIENAEIFEGVVTSQLTNAVSRNRIGELSKISIKTKDGGREIHCGYLTDRHTCPGFNRIDGATGKIWYHQIFGVLQWHLVNLKTGEEFDLTESAVRSSLRDDFSGERYFRSLAFAALFVLIVIVSARKKKG